MLQLLILCMFVMQTLERSGKPWMETCLYYRMCITGYWWNAKGAQCFLWYPLLLCIDPAILPYWCCCIASVWDHVASRSVLDHFILLGHWSVGHWEKMLFSCLCPSLWDLISSKLLLSRLEFSFSALCRESIWEIIASCVNAGGDSTEHDPVCTVCSCLCSVYCMGIAIYWRKLLATLWETHKEPSKQFR